MTDAPTSIETPSVTAAAIPTLIQQLETVVKAIIADLEKVGVVEAAAKAAELKPVLGAAARAYVAAHIGGTGPVAAFEREAATVAINALFGAAPVA